MGSGVAPSRGNRPFIGGADDYRHHDDRVCSLLDGLNSIPVRPQTLMDLTADWIQACTTAHAGGTPDITSLAARYRTRALLRLTIGGALPRAVCHTSRGGDVILHEAAFQAAALTPLAYQKRGIGFEPRGFALTLEHLGFRPGHARQPCGD